MQNVFSHEPLYLLSNYYAKLHLIVNSKINFQANSKLGTALLSFVTDMIFLNYRATTHTDLIIRAVELGIEYRVIHNSSIMNAIGCCGLQLYHFGETVSIPFWTESWKPDSFVDKIESNLQRGLHTLCLLGEL